MEIEKLADEMYNLLLEYEGKKKFKPGDLIKEMEAKYGDKMSRKDGKEALKLLVDTGKCVYSYAGGSFIEIAK